MLAGTRPVNLGVKEGRLAPCPATPNCVCSQADAAGDPDHYIAPLSAAAPPAAAWEALRSVLRDAPRVALIEDRPGYLRAEFTSRLLGFVDDAEFHLDQRAGVIHVRSASRLGRRDFGVNRRRIEDIRSKLAGRLQR